MRGGELRFPHGPQGEGDGFLTMDMNGIACRDLAQDEMLPVLIAHLKSLDFFDVMAYPTAQLDIPVSYTHLSPWHEAETVGVG